MMARQIEYEIERDVGERGMETPVGISQPLPFSSLRIAQRVWGNQRVGQLLRQQGAGQGRGWPAGGGGKVLQRKIGFEFETWGHAVIRKNSLQAALDEEVKPQKHNRRVPQEALPPGIEKAFDKTVIGKAKNFVFMGDDYYSEIVTRAIDEKNSSLDELMEIIGEVRAFAEKINVEGVLPLNQLPYIQEQKAVIYNKSGEKVQPAHYLLDARVGRGMFFNPHVTLGVRKLGLSHLIEVLGRAPAKGERAPQAEEMLSGQEEANLLGFDQSKGGQPYQQAFAHAGQFMRLIRKLSLLEEARGFLHLLALIMGGSKVGFESKDEALERRIIKYQLPILTRTSPGEAFLSLSQKEQQQLLKAQGKIVRHLVKVHGKQPLFAKNKGGISMERFIDGVFKGGNPLYDITQETSIGELRKENEDALRRYGIKHSTDIGLGREGIIVELRRLGINLAPNELPSFAIAAFRLAQIVNQEK